MSLDTYIDHYVNEYQHIATQLSNADLSWLQQLREAALQEFTALGLPKQQDENWKYTNINAITKQAFTVRAEPKQIVEPLPDTLALSNQYSLTFIDGHFSSAQSNIDNLPAGTIISDLASAIKQHPDIIKNYLGNLSKKPKNGFVALNTLFIQNGVFIFLPKNTVLDRPITLRFITTEDANAHNINLRNLIIAEDHTQAIIIEHYLGTNTNACFTNTITEIFVNQQAHLEHYKLIEESQKTFHISTVEVQQKSRSCFTSNLFTSGGALVRSDTNIELADEYAECTLNGLYLVKQRQHVDHHTIIDHMKPHCTSNEFYKGVIADFGRAVFNGKVFVRENAFKSDAKQANKNLLLSANAEIDTKPELEIYADDVQCAHGATVGQIDETTLFYLQSRGIDTATARTLLIYAFAREIIERIPLEALRQHLQIKLNQFF